MEVTNERVERYKETLRIMSLSTFSYHAGILLYAYSLGFLFTLIIIGGLFGSNILNYYGQTLEFFLIIFIYSMGTTNFSLFVGRFFSRARVSGELTTLFTIVFGLSFIFIFMINKNPWVYYLSYLVPGPTAF
jgi:hypothetical protein